MFIAAAAAGRSLDQEEVKRDLGKSALTDAVRPFMPPQDRVRFSAMTGQSLFYMGETDLAHKAVARGLSRPRPHPHYARHWPPSTSTSTTTSPEPGSDPRLENMTLVFRIPNPKL